MGTRSITQVINEEGVTKVFQYGQWDGDLRWVGRSIIKFLRDEHAVNKLKLNIEFTKLFDEVSDPVRWEIYTSICETNWRINDEINPYYIWWFNNFITRDLGEKVLYNIAYMSTEQLIEEPLYLLRDSGDDYAYKYIINFQDNTLTVEKAGVKKKYVWDLNNLPSIILTEMLCKRWEKD